MTSSPFDQLVTALEATSVQRLRAEIDNLRAIKTWAMTQLDVQFQPGDRVVIASNEPSKTGGGWHHYREALAPGQTGIAGEITFNAYANRWECLVGMDRAWSVHVDGRDEDTRTIRYWRGPAAETPEGFEAAAGDEGKAKHFAMDVRWIAPAPAVGLEAPHA